MMMVLERTFFIPPDATQNRSGPLRKTVAVRQYSIANFEFAFVAMLKGY
jgi:hypothetical protein